MSLGRSRPESLLVVGLDERDEGWTTWSQPVSKQGCQIGLDFPAQSGNPGCNGLPDSAGKSGNPVLPNTSGRRETRDETAVGVAGKAQPRDGPDTGDVSARWGKRCVLRILHIIFHISNAIMI